MSRGFRCQFIKKNNDAVHTFDSTRLSQFSSTRVDSTHNSTRLDFPSTQNSTRLKCRLDPKLVSNQLSTRLKVQLYSQRDVLGNPKLLELRINQN